MFYHVGTDYLHNALPSCHVTKLLLAHCILLTWHLNICMLLAPIHATLPNGSRLPLGQEQMIVKLVELGGPTRASLHPYASAPDRAAKSWIAAEEPVYHVDMHPLQTSTSQLQYTWVLCIHVRHAPAMKSQQHLRPDLWLKVNCRRKPG